VSTHPLKLHLLGLVLALGIGACQPVGGDGGLARPRLEESTDFGTVLLGGPPATRALILRNEGTGPLKVVDVRIVDDANGSFHFDAIEPGPADAPTSRRLLVTLYPSAAPRAESATLVLTLTGATPAEVRTQLRGETSVACPEGTTDCSGACVNLSTDVAYCGACDKSCTGVLHAGTAGCSGGKCTRGACEAGFFDLDGNPANGCEASCAGRVCRLPDGGTVTLASPPLPEGAVRTSAFVAAGQPQGVTQANAQHINIGTLADPTPLGRSASGTAASTLENATYKTSGGIHAAQPSP
jgi:hypothetical protein